MVFFWKKYIISNFSILDYRSHYPSSMFKQQTSFILASASPRRQEYLASPGISFETIPAIIDETPMAGESSAAFAIRMAQEKSQTVAQNNKNSCVIAADTVVTLGQNIFGKPTTVEEARTILRKLQGRAHKVITGVAVHHARKNIDESFPVETEVVFEQYSDAVIDAYIATGDPMDKAGGYGIQSYGGFLVKSINGSYSNVVGLPMSHLITTLLKHNLLTV